MSHSGRTDWKRRRGASGGKIQYGLNLLTGHMVGIAIQSPVFHRSLAAQFGNGVSILTGCEGSRYQASAR